MQMNNKIYPSILMLIMLFILASCIDEYNPKLGDASDLLVVDARLIKGDTIQYVYVSRSTAVDESYFNPVRNCEVKVVNTRGDEFYYFEVSEGTYQAIIPQEYLAVGEEFVLQLSTPYGNEYISDPETILESSPVDSIYYLLEEYTSSSEAYEEGAQFYIDLKAPDENTKNYRWTVEEDWEYHAAYTIAGYWDAEHQEFDDWFGFSTHPPRDTFFICYNNRIIPSVYASSTRNLTVNEKKKIPLQYVPFEGNKLRYNYSIRVKQYALSDAAYVYWNQNQVQNAGAGSLYETQPSQAQSNIYNINDESERVLGFFWASSYTEKRIALENTYSGTDLLCHADTIELLSDIPFNTYIAFIGLDPPMNVILGRTSATCLDCRESGGTVVKPDFFKN